MSPNTSARPSLPCARPSHPSAPHARTHESPVTWKRARANAICTQDATTHARAHAILARACPCARSQPETHARKHARTNARTGTHSFTHWRTHKRPTRTRACMLPARTRACAYAHEFTPTPLQSCPGLNPDMNETGIWTYDDDLTK